MGRAFGACPAARATAAPAHAGRTRRAAGARAGRPKGRSGDCGLRSPPRQSMVATRDSKPMPPRALARTLPKITRPALAKRGGAFASLIADWHNAVGPVLAECSLPERLTRA